MTWGLPKIVLWASALITFAVPLLALAYFLVQINIPFFNGGDRSAINACAFVYWLASSLFIFGWDIKKQ